jgi:hypothetical protein
MVLFFGVPMSLLELIGTPPRLWVPVLEFVVPITFAAVLFLTLIEHGVIRLIRRREENAEKSTDQNS